MKGNDWLITQEQKKIEFCVFLQVLRNVSLKDIKSTQRQPDLKVGTVCPLSSKM